MSSPIISKNAKKQAKRPKQKKRVVVAVPKGQPVKVKGRGSYSFSDFGKAVTKPFVDSTESKGAVNKIARFAGEQLGSSLGIPGAAKALGNAGSWLSRIFGFGAYKIKRNSLMQGNIAQFADNGSMTFSHREFVTDIQSSVAFTNSSYLINPGNPALFPWLSTIAQNYEEYEFLGLIFEFKSTSSTAVSSTNTGMGTVIMATDYDVIDEPYVSKNQMEVADFSTSGAPFNDQIHPIECDPRQNVLKKMYIQSATTIQGLPDDARFSVLGNLQIATAGMQSVSTIGELWVSYHVRLSKPQLNSAVSTQPAIHARFTTVTNAWPTSPAPVITQTVNGSFNVTGSAGLMVATALTPNAFGTYIAVLHCIPATTSVSSMLDAASYPTVTGGATLVANLTGRNNIQCNSAAQTFINSSVNYNTASPSIASGYGSISTIVFTVTAVGGGIVMPWMYDNATNFYNTLYLVPYNAAILGTTVTKEPKIKLDVDALVQQVLAEYKNSKNEASDTVVTRIEGSSDEIDPDEDDEASNTEALQHIDPKDLYAKGVISADELLTILAKQSAAKSSTCISSSSNSSSMKS